MCSSVSNHWHSCSVSTHHQVMIRHYLLLPDGYRQATDGLYNTQHTILRHVFVSVPSACLLLHARNFNQLLMGLHLCASMQHVCNAAHER